MRTEALVAVSQYQPQWLQSFDAYVAKQRDLVQMASKQNADILLFPEYASMELTALQEDAIRANLASSVAQLQNFHAAFVQLWQSLAKEFHSVIVAPSFPVQLAHQVVNRAYVFSPSEVSYQDKLIMTRFERESWGIDAGCERKVFNYHDICFAVAICYDSEFPLLVRPLAEAGAELLLVPSCTDTWAGYHRVKTACLARALENQIAVVQAPLVGNVDWSPAIDCNVGYAGVYLPMDYGCPDNGILMQGDGISPWHLQNIDLASLRLTRSQGQVLTYKHWNEQNRPSLGSARRIDFAS